MRRLISVDDESERVCLWLRDFPAERWEIQQFWYVQSFQAYLAAGGAPPDIIVLDMMIPPPRGTAHDPAYRYGTRTGLVLLEELRAVWPTVPVILFSNVNDGGVDETVVAFGRTCALSKWNTTDLVSEVENFLTSLEG